MKMNRTSTGYVRSALRSVVIVSSLLAGVGAHADKAEDVQRITDALRKQLPATRVDSVTLSPLPGIYEVVMDKNVAYVDGAAKYFVFGHLYDIQQQKDLTASRIASLDVVDFSKLPLEAAIKSLNGTAKRTLVVFADPNCGYCKTFEKSTAELKDTQVYTFVVGFLGDDSLKKAQAIWCAPDRRAAWNAWMVKGVQPPAASTDCAEASPVGRLTELTKALRIQGTPTLIAKDGRKLAGAGTSAEVIAWLDSKTADKR